MYRPFSNRTTAVRGESRARGGRFLDFDGSEGPAAFPLARPSGMNDDRRAERQNPLEPAQRPVGRVQATR
jgi:hypothetical protein